MAGISDPFAGFGPAAKAKFLILGSVDSTLEGMMNRARSLHLEHVSPLALSAGEISRRPVSAAAKEEALLARMRHWFFARKPDAGFVLTDFPATLLQAKVFDDWLEARHEGLDAVLLGAGPPERMVEHYRSLGLVAEAGERLPA